jgi:dienelactone hydrolase
VWFKDDESVLIYDRNDIWQLDPLNKVKPINLTNGYGKKNQIVFNFAFNEGIEDDVIKSENIYLTAFNTVNKKNGFFEIQLNRTGDPKILTMGSYIYCTNSIYIPQEADFAPIKAKSAAVYVVRRMSATEAPGYFSTRDFKTYIKLTNLSPEKNYNWYRTELHKWKSLDGSALQGILYKPENFDPNKRYPVIFHYYERKSDGLNAYMKPEPLCAGCAIDISTYVSNGYLVFTPDIFYKTGSPMQGTYDAVISAASYLSTLRFVNSKRMGIQGCSFGGFQTDYLVTHTDLFAAASSSSGISNLVSGYGSLDSDGNSQQSFHENGQLRIGASLWDRPDAYIRNSPIFSVDKVSTPLLIMHTTNDGLCLYPDALQFFNGLRRMGKKAWMLVYPNENHGLWIKKNVDDFSIRMMQFFDHYLKDKPAPVWMTKGIPASRRGLDNGYKYDTESSTPGAGLLNPAEQGKVDSLMIRNSIKIILK